ncbi:MAG: acyltransferase [Anaerolineales bacterium]|nr:acyltransferase [Anaerolineales bacterium]
MTTAKPTGRKHPISWGFWSLLAWLRLIMVGAKVGRGLRSLGPILLRIEPDWRGRIVIGDNVTLLPYVDFRLRDEGQIVLGNGVYLETMARLVVANRATLTIGAESQIGMGSILNAGDDIRIGDYVAIAAHCSLIASEHAYFDTTEMIKYQGYIHAPITIEDNVWLAASVLVRPGVTIGSGAVIGVQSVVHRDIPTNVVAVGNPAKPIKQRTQ